jgi:hypothetical protein
MATITKAESRRRERTNKVMFPLALIDKHNDERKPCECCKRDETANGECFEDSDGAHVCNYCYWTRTDRVTS